MNLDFDALFPDGLSDETANAIAELLQELCFVWEGRYYGQLARLAQQRQADLFDPDPPWLLNSED
jgi:hypothetical protein